MFSPFTRRRRKASPDPDSRIPSPPSESPEQGRRRRRTSESESQNLLLPTTYLLGKKKPPSQLPSFQPGNTCNNFLLGGQFYPGKDKKRKHMRRRAIWHRIFFSSPWRAVLTVLLASYVALWHVIVPTTYILLDLGRRLSGGKHGFMVISSLSLPSLEQQRIEAVRLKEERDRIQYSGDRRHEERMKVLERIVPNWFHRNDAQQDKPPAKEIIPDNPMVSDDEAAHAQHPRRGGASPKPRRNQPNGKIDAKIMERGSRHGKPPKIVANSTDDVVNENEAGNKKKGKSGQPKSAADSEGAVVSSKSAEKAEKAEPDAADPLIKSNVSDAGDRSKITEKPKPYKADPLVKKFVDTEQSGPLSSSNATAPLANDSEKTAGDFKSVERTLQNMDTTPSQSSCPSVLSAEETRTTLVIQSSLDRLWILDETCKRWKSPIVVAVHLPHDTADDHPSIAAAREKCSELTIVPYKATREEQEWEYPVNRLRNMALDAVRTSHVLTVDIDFIPSMFLDELIRSTVIEQQALIDYPEGEAMVVPAFERLPPAPCSKENDCSVYLKTNSSFIPQTLAELRSCVIKKECSVFQLSNNWEGHHSTRSESWLKGDWYETEVRNMTNATAHTLAKRIRTIKCFDSLRYEPYVVLRWCPVSFNSTENKAPVPVSPYYDERFYGYGKNKIQLISHLRFMGYHFSVLPIGFIVHNPHSESLPKQTWNDAQKNNLHNKMDALYPEFLEELWNKYKATTKYIVQHCQPPKKNENAGAKKS